MTWLKIGAFYNVFIFKIVVYIRLFQIIVDRPQEVTDSENKNIEVIILIIIKREK